MIIFYKPQYLFLLFLIPLLIFLHINSLRTSKTRAIKFANFDAIRRINGVEIFSKNLTVLYINIFIIVLLVLSVSGMRLTTEVDASKLSFVIAIDSSISMAAQDISPTRFDAAKKAAIDFLSMVPTETRIGIVSFSTNSIIEQEVTSDKTLIKPAISNIILRSSGGTDGVNALITAANLLSNEDSKSIILMSDGGINANDVQQIIDYANKNRIAIYTLGIGTTNGGSDTNGAYYKLSEDTLKLVAENTGGMYYNIVDVDGFYNSLNNVIQTVKKKIVLDMSFYLLLLALILLIINFYISSNRYRIFP